MSEIKRRSETKGEKRLRKLGMHKTRKCYTGPRAVEEWSYVEKVDGDYQSIGLHFFDDGRISIGYTGFPPLNFDYLAIYLAVNIRYQELLADDRFKKQKEEK